jgi:hypothetical protein
LAGKRWAPGHDTVFLLDSSDNTIGGADPKDRNIIAVGEYVGIRLETKYGRPSTSNNVIAGNYLGLTPDGSGVLNVNQGQPDGITGIVVGGDRTVGNLIGGEADGAGNLFGGMANGVKVIGAKETEIKGNLFGLKADGDSLAWIGTSGIAVESAATNTQIGGAAPGARNVFAGGECYAIQIFDAGTNNTVVSGNYFGTNRDGTERRRLVCGVWIPFGGVGRTTIGGSTPSHGNYFTPSRPDGWGEPLRTYDAGPITIRHNRFGILPQGGDKTGIGTAITVYGGDVRISDNTIAQAGVYGLLLSDGAIPSYASVQRNLFRHCGHSAIWIVKSTCCLGDLGNASGTDDGGNEFKASNTMFIGNSTDHTIKAEGNKFPSTVKAEIDTKIFDKQDCAGAGRVDFDPLFGGVSPTGWAASLALTGAVAVPTTAGAQITFSLSAPAQVTITVLNVAGRPVATVARDRALDGGTQHFLWSGRADSGTAVPAGVYLVRVAARSEAGGEASVLARLALR